MASRILPLLLASLATASPIIPPRKLPSWPVVSTAKSFHLVVNVTDPSLDTISEVPIHGQRLIGVHSGAGLEAPTVTDEGTGIGFYVNGTSTASATIQWDAGIRWPFGMQLYDAFDPETDPLDRFGLNIGNGSVGFGVYWKERPCPAVYAPKEGTFVVCDAGFSAPGHPRLQVRFAPGKDRDGWYGHEKLPAGCVPVKLVPECTELLDLPEDAEYDHEYVIESRCYKDVKAIEWEKYHECL